MRSPVDGYIDNLRLRVGDYATAGFIPEIECPEERYKECDSP
jgi:multidrug resistance efflux pump